MKKLLIVSPIYPFPEKCGLSRRISDMCRNITDVVEIHFFTFSDAPGKVPLLDGGKIFKKVTFADLQGSPMMPGNSLCHRIRRAVCPPHFDSSYYVPDRLLHRLKEIHRSEKFDSCMIVTPNLARCLMTFPVEVFKIIDTIDVWSQRASDFKKIRQGALLSQFRDSSREIDWLKKADLVIAISLWDFDYFCCNGLSPIHVPVSFMPSPLPAKSPSVSDILYPAGRGPTNTDAIRFMMDDIMPIVRHAVPEARLLVPNPDQELKDAYAGRDDFVSLPFLENIRDAYSMADLVAVPLRVGSGLKIKVLESFAFGKPTIVSPAAAQGIPMDSYAQNKISANPEEFASEVVDTLSCVEYRRQLIESGLDIIKTLYNPEKVYGELKNRLS
ncbi:MAG: glycosyltransferase family 4 protein [Victivallales bacterium]|nr:glycosyltransferase family 4 protein [Victivallales bacterium]